MMNCRNVYRHVNPNYKNLSPHTGQNGHHQKNLQTINAGEGVEKREPSCTIGGECKSIQPLRRTVRRFRKKLKIELPYDPAIPLLGIYPKKTIIQKVTCTPMFTAALFTIARTWKQPKCPLTDEWIRKMWYIYGLLLSHKKK